MSEAITDDLTSDEEYPIHKLHHEDAIIELATSCYSHGMSKREAETFAADSLDADPMGEKQNLQTLTHVLDIDQSTIRSHFQNSKESAADATTLDYMTRDSIPTRILASFSFSSTNPGVDKVEITVGKSYAHGADQPSLDESEYVLFISEYESSGWHEYEYRGEQVRRVMGRTKVVDETNRLLKEYRSNTNPVRVIGELMYALNLPGLIDPSDEYCLRIKLIDPLCSPNSPPEGYDEPPMTFANFSSVVNRFEQEE